MIKSTALLSLTGLLLKVHASSPLALATTTLPQLGLPPSAPTPAPVRPRRAAGDLFRRQSNSGDSNTCGLYSNGDAYTCYEGTTCGTSNGHFGCCDGAACPLSTACLDSTATECLASTQGLETLCCNYSTDQPYCVTIVSTTGTNSFTDFRCGNRQWASEVQTITALSEQSSKSSTATSGSDVPGDSTGTATTATTTSGSDSDGSGSSSSKKKKSNAGAIAGGVVGGIAVIGMIAFAVVYFRGKKKTKDANSGGSSPPGPTYQAVPLGPPGGNVNTAYGGPGGYSPNPEMYGYGQQYPQQYPASTPAMSTVTPTSMGVSPQGYYPPIDPKTGYPMATVAPVAPVSAATPMATATPVAPTTPMAPVSEVDGTSRPQRPPVELA